MESLTDEQLANLTVAEVMTRWPQVLPLFNRYRLACGGCVMAEFCTIADVPASYEHVTLAPFLTELRALIEVDSPL
jgi:hypothetical protein